MRIIAALVALVLISTGYNYSPANAAETEAKGGDRVVCKLKQRTGTRFKNKICKTADQWEEMAEQGRSGIKEMVDRPHVPICGPNGCD